MTARLPLIFLLTLVQGCAKKESSEYSAKLENIQAAGIQLHYALSADAEKHDGRWPLDLSIDYDVHLEQYFKNGVAHCVWRYYRPDNDDISDPIVLETSYGDQVILFRKSGKFLHRTLKSRFLER